MPDELSRSEPDAGTDGGSSAARAVRRLRHHRGVSLPSLDPRLCRRHRHGHRRRPLPRSHRAHPQPAVSRAVRYAVRRQRVHAAQSLGRFRHLGSGPGRNWRHLARLDVRTGGAGARRPRSHGCRLLSLWRHPSRRGGGEVARFGTGDRQRRRSRPRGSHHPDRLGLGFDLGPNRSYARRSADHAGCRRRRRGHRRHVQHAHRRRHVRDRTHDARGQRAHFPAGGNRHRRGDVCRPIFPRGTAGISGTGASAARYRSRLGAPPGSLWRAGRPHRNCRDRVHSRPPSRGRPLSQDQRPLLEARARHGDGGRADLHAAARSRALLCRGCGLRDDPGGAAGFVIGGGTPRAALPLQTHRHFVELGLWFLGRDSSRPRSSWAPPSAAPLPRRWWQ